ncbi:MAG: hypothetical protein JXN60_00720, partial [Lentisphaerae bacterium]|nr:hypothetical protein [Lentisphaerota bacterium]
MTVPFICPAALSCRIRSADKWLLGYLRSVLTRPRILANPVHLIFCIADHFEPFRYGEDTQTARRNVREWTEQYAKLALEFNDSDGKHPQHTFFYPGEQYESECVENLSDLFRKRFGEVEIHLHHRDDTQDSLRRKLVEFRDLLRSKHGLLGSDSAGGIRYGFIHGNWALCNSGPDGDWCGVNEELSVLFETGCYADFTFPSAPSPTQPRMVNMIYRATGNETKPRAHDVGQRLRVRHQSDLLNRDGGWRTPVIIQGPLTVNWRSRKWGI